MKSNSNSEKGQNAAKNQNQSGSSFQNKQRSPHLIQLQRQQKQRIKQLYRQINVEKQKAKRLQKQQNQKIQKLNKKVLIENQNQLYQSVDDNQYTQIPVDGQVFLGSRVYTVSCASCHSLQTITANRDNGPSLGLLFNRKVGTDLNYWSYTKATLEKSFYWSSKNLYNFMADPMKMLPGTSCGLSVNPIKDQGQRADLVQFLKEYSKQLELNIRIELIKKQGYDLYQTKLYAEKVKKNKVQNDLRNPNTQ